MAAAPTFITGSPTDFCDITGHDNVDTGVAYCGDLEYLARPLYTHWDYTRSAARDWARALRRLALGLESANDDDGTLPVTIVYRICAEHAAGIVLGSISRGEYVTHLQGDGTADA
jgi:hypothetical protein